MFAFELARPRLFVGAAVVLFSLLVAGGAGAKSDAEIVRGLFPKSKIRAVTGEVPANVPDKPKNMIAPVYRGDQVGYINVDSIRAVDVRGKFRLLTFKLFTTKVEKSFDAEVWNADPPMVAPGEEIYMMDWPQRDWNSVLAVIVVEKATGRFMSKPAGFPLERTFNAPCMGDVCNQGHILRDVEVVDASAGVVALVTASGYMDSYQDSVYFLRVLSKANFTSVAKPMSSGSLNPTGDECDPSRTLGKFEVVDGNVYATQSEHCKTEPPCPKECETQGIRNGRKKRIPIPLEK